jgi:hypothetical protein
MPGTTLQSAAKIRPVQPTHARVKTRLGGLILFLAALAFFDLEQNALA